MQHVLSFMSKLVSLNVCFLKGVFTTVCFTDVLMGTCVLFASSAEQKQYIQNAAEYTRKLCRSRGNVHWKQIGGGGGNMTAGSACSAGDLVRHLPPGARRSKKQ